MLSIYSFAPQNHPMRNITLSSCSRQNRGPGRLRILPKVTQPAQGHMAPRRFEASLLLHLWFHAVIMSRLAPCAGRLRVSWLALPSQEGLLRSFWFLVRSQFFSHPTWLRVSASAKSLNHQSLALEPTTLTPLLTCKHKFKQGFTKLLTVPGKRF